MDKRSSRDDPMNYWHIAIIPTTGRIYSRILTNLIEEDIENQLLEDQAAF